MKWFTLGLCAMIMTGVILSGCSKSSNSVGVVTPTDTTKRTDTVYVPNYHLPYLMDSDFYNGVVLGSLDPVTLKEASGIAASRVYSGCFWTHNDSGNPNDVFLIDSTAKIRAIVMLSGIGNRDWEDIAVGPGPTPGVSYVYVGEIGDNNTDHSWSAVYRFPEPSVMLDTIAHISSVSNVDQIIFHYPDGPHNAETLIVDPLTKDLYIATKGSYAILFEAPYPQAVDSNFVIKKLALLPLSTLTAGDISSDGSEILMKNYQTVYYWKRTAGQSVVSSLLNSPLLLPYIQEQQGEAICWSPNADAYYTTSEYTGAPAAPAPLYKYKHK